MSTELHKLLNQFPDKPWDWRFLSGNPNITMEYVLAHPDKPWSWYNISFFILKPCRKGQLRN